MPYRQVYEALRQRKIVQTLIVYVGGSWGLLQALSLFQQTYGWPRAVMDVALFLLACGLVAAETIAWFHGERGHQRVTRTELAILAPVVVVAGLGGWALAVRPPAADPETAAATPERTLLVMPFVNSTRDTALTWLQKGMVEMLSTDLAQRPQLHVVSGERVFDLLREQGAADATVIGEPIADKVAARASAGYVVRGAVFRLGTTFRFDAQLVQVSDGTVAASAQAVGPDVFTLVDTLAERLAGHVVTDSAVTATPTAGSARPAPLSQVATGNVDAYREFHAGLEAERRVQGPEAMAHFQRALALDSTFPQALFHLGRLELEAGDYAAARQHLDRAQATLRRAPARERRFAGALIATREDLPAATGALEQLTRRYPDDKDAWLWLARAYALDPARGADRERALRQVLRLDGSYGPAYAELADELARRGDYARADSAALRYVAAAPGEPEPLDARGEILERAGRYAEARGSYLAALRLHPDFVPALEHLARTGTRSGEVQQASADLAPYLSASDAMVRLRARLLTGDLLLWRGRVDDALAAADQARGEAEALGPQAQDMALRSALALWQLLGDRERVLRTLAPMIQGPEPRFLLEYAAALGELGRSAELQALARRIQALPAGGPTGPPGPPGPGGPPPAGRPTAPAPAPVEPPQEPGRAGRAAGTADELAAYAAYYRGDWAGAIARFRAGRSARAGRPGEEVDPREVLALLHAGRAAEALPLVEPFDTAGFGRALTRHEDLYLQARVYEASGRTAAAVHSYRLLLQDWGGCIGRFPAYHDAPARLARLTR